MVLVLVTDANIIKVPLEEHIIQRQFLLLEVVSILYVLVVHIVVVPDNVQDAMVVHPM